MDYEHIGDLVIERIREVVGDAATAADVDLAAVCEAIYDTLLREEIDPHTVVDVRASADGGCGSYYFYIVDRMSHGGALIEAPHYRAASAA
jgi:hypothetical protein